MNNHIASAALALCLAAIATPLQSEESLVGTAWQCGRDYLVITLGIRCLIHFSGGIAQRIAS